MNFAKKLKETRIDKNYTQEELANKLNVSRKTLSGWENNRSVPDIATIKIIANKLDKTVPFFIDEENSVKHSKFNDVLNYLNMIILIINFITSYTPFHIIGLSTFEIIIIITILISNEKINFKVKPIKYRKLILSVIFIVFAVVNIDNSVTILKQFYIGGFFGSLLRAVVMLFSTNLMIEFFERE
ncbi:helix-turn-helix domain-containing protein [Fructilactobacillus sp. Tb1]|uniref:helix-turn-helix domain-containing protein n=1 Tax=Fructilactobacillus sp. Tb1 TaxID=3422304 RepID=UPI003D2C6E96